MNESALEKQVEWLCRQSDDHPGEYGEPYRDILVRLIQTAVLALERHRDRPQGLPAGMAVATKDRGERLAQKAILNREYEDYDARHHDAFVTRYNSDCEARRLREYMENRGIIERHRDREV